MEIAHAATECSISLCVVDLVKGRFYDRLRAYPKRGLTLSGEAEKLVKKQTRLQRVRPFFG